MNEKNKKKEINNKLVKYDSLTIQEKKQLLIQLQQNKSSLESRIKEKQDLIENLKRQLDRQELDNKIDTLTKQTKDVKPVVSDPKTKTVIIECSGGLIVDVKGLPEGYEYAIHDYDNKGICKICGDEVQEWEFRDHLEGHNPNAKQIDWHDLYEFFDEVC